MIPLRLDMSNFMCYHDDVLPIDFSGLHVICLSGDNGAGKSAILDAITWALWGKARARDDELIRLGGTEMKVTLDFALGDTYHRVIRTRNRKGNGLTMLDFQVKHEETWRSLMGNSVRDTQAKINDALKMDYEVFINSAFIMQGRADEFTVKTAGERKKVLGDILGLSLFDELEVKARERGRTADVERKNLTMQLQEVGAQLLNKQRFTDELTVSVAEVNRLSTEAEALREELATIKERLNALGTQKKELDRLEERLKRTEKELETLRRDLRTQETRQAEEERLLARSGEIELNYQNLLKARETLEEQNKKMRLLTTLRERQNHLQKQIDSARTELEKEQARLQSEVKNDQQRANELQANETTLRNVAAQIASLPANTAAELSASRNQREDLTTEKAEKTSENKRLKKEMDELKRHLDELPDQTCPTCGTSIGAKQRAFMRTSYEAEGGKMGALWRSNKGDIATCEEKIAALDIQIEQLTATQTSRSRLEDRHTLLVETIERDRKTLKDLEARKRRLEEVQKALVSRHYAQDNQTTLASIVREIETLGYDQTHYEQAQQQIKLLSNAEGEQQRLQLARERLATDTEIVERTRGTIASREEEQKEDLAARNALQSAFSSYKELIDQESIVSSRLERGERLHDQARTRLGQAQQKLVQMDELETQREIKHRAFQRAAEEKSLYDELTVAFSKKGIQAMIIETAIPEIEKEANDLLTRMSDGRLNVKFETQRDTKKGDTAETLEIKISDELGTRNYELYSGGEAFRVNFAIRIALSRLLARRAGAKLQTLAIDEGFGTQDGAGRERLIEAIHSIEDDFERIIVVTHLQDLKDAFPNRIDVVKTASGSQAYVIE